MIIVTHEVVVPETVKRETFKLVELGITFHGHELMVKVPEDMTEEIADFLKRSADHYVKVSLHCSGY